jgi:hypothetical protein
MKVMIFTERGGSHANAQGATSSNRSHGCGAAQDEEQ